MFGWLGRAFVWNPGIDTRGLWDRWYFASGYVVRYRPHLEEVAHQLSSPERPVHTRFNRTSRHAELVTGEDVLVEVWVEGEFSTPERMFVQTTALSQEECDVFRRQVPLRVQFRPFALAA